MLSNAVAEGLLIPFPHKVLKVDAAGSARLLREQMLGKLSGISCVEPLDGATPLGFAALLGDALLGGASFAQLLAGAMPTSA